MTMWYCRCSRTWLNLARVVAITEERGDGADVLHIHFGDAAPWSLCPHDSAALRAFLRDDEDDIFVTVAGNPN